MNTNGSVFNYTQYMDWMTSLVAGNKTSGQKQSPALISFTALNLKRMERLNKTMTIENKISGALFGMQGKQIWYVIAEPWCGDCAQNLPVIGKIAELSNGLIDLRIIQRNENPDWMEKYHTNGSLSIPKLIAFNTSGKELFTWGARPKEAQGLLDNWKKNADGKTWDDFEKDLHMWYARNKTKSIQHEFYKLLSASNEINTIYCIHFIPGNNSTYGSKHIGL